MKRASRIVVILLAVLGVVFVARTLIRDWDEVSAAAADADARHLIVAFCLGITSMTLIGVLWRRALGLLGASLPIREVLRSYFVGQLGKYVPGGIWPVVGRAEMARGRGAQPAVAYGSTVLSMGLTYLAAALTALAALALGGGRGGPLPWWALLLVGLVGLLAIHPKAIALVVRVLRRISRRPLETPLPPWKSSLGLVLAHLPVWIGVGLATWLIASTLDPGQVEPLNIVFAASLSWLVGFVAIGAPGGIGVREAVFIATATSISSAGIAAGVAVVARIMFVFVDLAGAGIATLVARVRQPD